MTLSFLPAPPLLDAAGGFMTFGILGFVVLAFLAPFVVMAVVLLRRAVQSKRNAAPPNRKP